MKNPFNIINIGFNVKLFIKLLFIISWDFNGIIIIYKKISLLQ